MKSFLPLLLIFCFELLSLRANAVEYRTVEHAGKKFTICVVDLDHESLRLFLKDDKGAELHNFPALDAWLHLRRQRLVFAMNGGMYHVSYAPVGVFVSEGREVAPLNLNPGEGNFFLKPNGVFLVTDAGAAVVEASRYPAVAAKAKLATQSGPMLVLDGKLHPAFRADSVSRLFRNGVGVANPRQAIFAISEEAVNFFEFATLFRDALHCPNALFLDGTISSLFAPPLQRNDVHFPLGPILGVTADLEPADANARK